MALGNINVPNTVKIDEKIKALMDKDVEIEKSLNEKALSDHTHNYAGSDSVGGVATSAKECTGNSATATKATQDANGNVITDTYATKSTIGTTDISSIGDTVTSAISNLNSKLSLVADVFPANRVIYKQLYCVENGTITIDLANYIDTIKQFRFTVCLKAEHDPTDYWSLLNLNRSRLWAIQGNGTNATYGTGFYYMRCKYSYQDDPNITIGEIKSTDYTDGYELSTTKNDDNTLSVTNIAGWTSLIGILIIPTEFEQLVTRFDGIYVTKDELQSLENRISALENR